MESITFGSDVDHALLTNHFLELYDETITVHQFEPKPANIFSEVIHELINKLYRVIPTLEWPFRTKNNFWRTPTD